MGERKPTLVLGYFVGTSTGWDQADDWSIILYDFEPYKGFDMPAGDLGVDYQEGVFENYDEEGNVSLTKKMVPVMDAYLSTLPKDED